MIFDKNKQKSTSEDATPTDAPPPYTSVLNMPGPSNAPLPPLPPSSHDHPKAPSLFTHSSTSFGSSSSQPPRKLKQRAKSSPWFSFGLSKSAKQTRTTVQDLLRNLIHQHPSTEFADVLVNCREACEVHGLDFSAILQDGFIEGHTPVYWAIVKRPVASHSHSKGMMRDGDREEQSAGLVMALLSYMNPLTPLTISEVRHACTLNSDHRLFTSIRERFVAFAPLVGSDAILLGNENAGMGSEGARCDKVVVMEERMDPTVFEVRMEVLMFQLRMRVTGSVKVEFIARGRMWCINFQATNKGPWTVTLGLSDHSPQTYVDSRLVICDARSYPNPNPIIPISSASSPSSSPAQRAIPPKSSRHSSLGLPATPPPPPQHPARNSIFVTQGKGKGKMQPNIIVRLRSGNKQLQARPDGGKNGKSGGSGSGGGGGTYEIVEVLEKGIGGGGSGASLQYETHSPYVDARGTLRATFEARLVKTSLNDTECVIC